MDIIMLDFIDIVTTESMMHIVSNFMYRLNN
jgi:hypothetical protein